jgi:hypothetical protein
MDIFLRERSQDEVMGTRGGKRRYPFYTRLNQGHCLMLASLTPTCPIPHLLVPTTSSGEEGMRIRE